MGKARGKTGDERPVVRGALSNNQWEAVTRASSGSEAVKWTLAALVAQRVRPGLLQRCHLPASQALPDLLRREPFTKAEQRHYPAIMALEKRWPYLAMLWLSRSVSASDGMAGLESAVARCERLAAGVVASTAPPRTSGKPAGDPTRFLAQAPPRPLVHLPEGSFESRPVGWSVNAWWTGGE